MSRKSRPPESGKKNKKGRKGKKGKTDESLVYQEVIEEPGFPFGVVVLVALAMSLPSLMAFFDGTLEFRPAIVRLLAALLVSWLLVALVHSVVASFDKTTETTTETHTESFDPGMGATSYGGDPYGDQGRAAS